MNPPSLLHMQAGVLAAAGRKAGGRLTPLCWNPREVAPHWRQSLYSLGEYYPVRESAAPSGGELELRMAALAGASTDSAPARARREGSVITIEAHPGFPVGRLVARALAGCLHEGRTVEDRAHFACRSVLFDVARNAVLTPGALRRWFCHLYLMGFNQAVLYLEDIFAIGGEPYFGYLRGRYSEEDLRTIDASAAAFGIELVASIQTLAHLSNVLRWPVYAGIRHNADTLAVGKQESYDLIEKMIAVMSRTLRSRRIHVGMDESARIGFEDFQKHLRRVNDLCRAHGYTAVDIWSDMYFRMNSPKHDYRDGEIVIPPSMHGCVPGGVNLVYWDYYSTDRDFYVNWIGKHRELSGGRAPVVAAGLWTWDRTFWYDQRRVDDTLPPAVRACREAGVSEVMFTMWRDGGAYSHYPSTLAGLAAASDLCFVNDAWTAEVFDALIGVPRDAILAVSSAARHLLPAMIAWDDPLLGLARKMFDRLDPGLLSATIAHYDDILRRVAPHADITDPVDMAFGVAMLRFLRDKAAFQRELADAHAAGDRPAVGRLAAALPRLVERLEAFRHAFNRQWHDAHRPHGIEAMQARFGAQLLRLLDAQARLGDYADGRADTLPELDENIDPPLPGDLSGESPHFSFN